MEEYVKVRRIFSLCCRFRVLSVVLVLLAAGAQTAMGEEGTKKVHSGLLHATTRNEPVPCIAYQTSRGGTQLSTSMVAVSYGTYTTKIMVVNYNDKGTVDAICESGGQHSCEWSPDGKHLSFVEGHKLVVFTNGQKSTLDGYSVMSYFGEWWSPQSDRIAFIGCKKRGNEKALEFTSLYIFNIFKKSVRRVADMNGKWGHSIHWLKQGNGDTLLLASTKDGIQTMSIPQDGLAPAPKTIFKPSSNIDYVLSISKNGATATISANDYLWRFDLDGKESRRLTNTIDLKEYGACWSPTDENLVAFCGTSADPSLGSALYLYLVDRNEMKRVEIPPTYESVSELNWSGDGRYIAATGLHKDTSSPPRDAADIIMLDVAASKWHALTHSADSREFAPIFRF